MNNLSHSKTIIAACILCLLGSLGLNNFIHGALDETIKPAKQAHKAQTSDLPKSLTEIELLKTQLRADSAEVISPEFATSDSIFIDSIPELSSTVQQISLDSILIDREDVIFTTENAVSASNNSRYDVGGIEITSTGSSSGAVQVQVGIDIPKNRMGFHPK